MIRIFRNNLLALLVALVLATPATLVRAADHGDAPTAAQDLAADINDAYIFRDPNDGQRLILILTVHGFIVPAEAGNFGIFDPALRYRFEIERTGDARPDAFIDVTFNRRVAVNAVAQAQTATIGFSNFPGLATRVFTAPSTNASATSATPPTQIVTNITSPNTPPPAAGPNDILFFAGLTDDPFFFDIPAFGRFVTSVRAGAANPAFLQRARDSFAGYNTMAIAFSVPIHLIRGVGNELGFSTATQRRNPEIYNSRTNQIQGSGRWVNIDRTGVPAVNVALVPFAQKDDFNAANTLDDAAGRFAPGIVATLMALGTNQANINTLAAVAVTRGDILRLDLTVANSGTGGGNNAGAGFPNGRRIRDDVIDTELNIITNGVITAGDNVNANELTFGNTFPFLAQQHPPRDTGTDDNTRN